MGSPGRVRSRGVSRISRIEGGSQPPAPPCAAGSMAAEAGASAEDWRAAGFGLYLHWPFCQSKCPYCDFNSHVAGAVDESRWARALQAEIARIAAETGPRTLTSVFLGGGTPSLMSPELVGSVLGAARAGWPMAEDVEITLEANPTSVEAGGFAATARRASTGSRSGSRRSTTPTCAGSGGGTTWPRRSRRSRWRARPSSG